MTTNPSWPRGAVVRLRRGVWRCGGWGPGSRGRGRVQFANSRGFHDLLGLMLLSLGFSSPQLREFNGAQSLRFLPRPRRGKPEDCRLAALLSASGQPTGLAVAAAGVNDTFFEDDDERDVRVSSLLWRHGVPHVFSGAYVVPGGETACG